MPLTIGTNIASLKARRKLGENTDSLSRIYERLSSGQRITHASDDAAGLAIASTLKSDARVFTQAIRNINDGISLSSVASSALESLTTIVNRQAELAEQASSGTFSSTQRQAMDREFQALSQEYTRITASTSFNGISLLSSTQQNIAIQADKSQINIALPAVSTPTQSTDIAAGDSSLLASWRFEDGSGSTVTDSSTNGTNASTPNGTTWNSGQVGGGASFNGVDQYLSASNINFSSSAVTVSFWMNESSYTTHGTIFESSANFNGSTTGFGLFQSDPTVGGANTLQLAVKGDNSFNIKVYTPPTAGWHYYTAVLDKSQNASGEVQLYIDGTLQTAASQPFNADNSNSFGSNSFYMLSRAGSSEFLAASLDQVRIYNRSLSGSEIQTLYQETGALSLSTQASALTALDSMNTLRASLIQSRGLLGATESRLSVASNYLKTLQLESLSAAGRITDADTASDAAELVRRQILQQASTAILAQANQQPALVLKLLR